MKFKTAKEALDYAGKDYIRNDKMVIMSYSKTIEKLISKWFHAKDMNKKLIMIDDGKFYYYKDNIGLFPTEDDIIYISEEEFKKGWNQQYWNWLIEEAKKDSNNYIFKGYETEDSIKSRDAIFGQITKLMFL